MNKNLMDILACPVCKGELTLEIEVEKDGRVEIGSLECNKCDGSFVISGGIPNLLPPEMND